MAHIVVKRRSIRGIATGVQRLGHLKCARLKFLMSYKEDKAKKDQSLLQLQIECMACNIAYAEHTICYFFIFICHVFLSVV
jgi:hypothetical protein